MATNIDKELKNLGKKRDEQIELFIESTREKAVQIMTPAFANIFEQNEKLTHIFVTGYTPGWNDGEECVHDTNVLIYNDLDGWNELAEFLECHLRWDVDYDNPSEHLLAVNKGLSKSECNDIEDSIPVAAMSEALGTDWLIIATKSGVELRKFNVGY